MAFPRGKEAPTDKEIPHDQTKPLLGHGEVSKVGLLGFGCGAIAGQSPTNIFVLLSQDSLHPRNEMRGVQRLQQTFVMQILHFLQQSVFMRRIG